MNKELSSVETIIARLDNDFNIMSSDYIPRVGAWCIDAMNEMGILQYEEKETTVDVVDRVAYFACYPGIGSHVRFGGGDVNFSCNSCCCHNF